MTVQTRSPLCISSAIRASWGYLKGRKGSNCCVLETLGLRAAPQAAFVSSATAHQPPILRSG
jgi:hypothetical protein